MIKLFRIRFDNRYYRYYIVSRKWYWPFTYTWSAGYFSTYNDAIACVDAKLKVMFFNFNL